jgi:hypothetical protein
MPHVYEVLNCQKDCVDQRAKTDKRLLHDDGRQVLANHLGERHDSMTQVYALAAHMCSWLYLWTGGQCQQDD